jgi:hypothetical protein
VEFHDLKYARDSFVAEKWDGVISVATTSLSDNEVYNYTINLSESIPTKRLTKLPSSSKNGVKFSGTEVSFLLTLEVLDELAAVITSYLHKVLVLKNHKIAFELVVGEVPRLHYEIFDKVNTYFPPNSVSNIECLKSGLEDYILKHGSTLRDNCHSCFSTGECLKVGCGVACSTGKSSTNGWVVESVIVISESSQQINPSCFRPNSSKTEVLYFKDFSPNLIPQSSVNALTSIDWKSYGLKLMSLADHEDGSALLEWENLPPNIHIDIALHCHHKKLVLPLAKQKDRSDQTLTRKALKLALDDLKKKNAGVLLSAHANKIRSYAPDLAKTLAGLILSSNDSNFKEECIALLGLNCEGTGSEMVEECIKERITSVIELNDRRPQGSKEAETFLFEDEYIQKLDFMDAEYEEGDESFTSFDL